MNTELRTREPLDSKILVVDDEPENLRIVGEVLKRDGLPFIFATNGEEALEAVAEEAPVLILLDIMMPGDDGITVCKKLKENPVSAHIPVIFLTAKSEKEHIVEGFSAGGIDYITKPFFRQELLARIHTHIQLYQAKKHLNALYQSKKQLLTTLAHDVKNPSGAIGGIANLLLEELNESNINTKELESCLSIIHASAVGLTELVEETLDEERSEHGEFNFQNNGPVSVNEVIQHLIGLNKINADKKGLNIQFHYNSSPRISISKRVLTEIFDNLISNAIKYSRQGGEITVRLSESSDNQNAIRIDVDDSAELITDDQKAQLFKTFQQGDTKPIFSGSSHGVGLSIVKRMVTLLNGEVNIETRPDKLGNRFYVTLPLES